jgi:hypothetical protein
MKGEPGRREWSLPDGKRTRSFRKHEKAWRDIYAPVEREFHLSCNGYDPGAQFHGDEPGEFVSLPTWFLIKLARVCNEAAECRLLNEHMAAS